MSDTQTYPYDTHLDLRFRPLELIDEKALSDSVTHPWYNQTLCRVNGSVVRLGVIRGEYHWHQHANDDEFFYVVEGQLLIDLEGRVVELSPRQGFVVPKGTLHRTRAPERTVILAPACSWLQPRIPTRACANSEARSASRAGWPS